MAPLFKEPWEYSLGRAHELRELSNALRNLKNPFILVRGAAGVGKTSLVRAAVAENAKRFSEIEWVDASGGMDYLQPLSRELGPERHIIQPLGYGPLLVVDDAEGLSYADEFASRLFHERKHLGVIIITRDVVELRYANFTVDLGPIPTSIWMKIASDKFQERAIGRRGVRSRRHRRLFGV